MLHDPVRMHRASTIRRRFALCVIGALGLIVAVVIGMTLATAAERREADRWHTHTFEVLLASGKLETAINLTLRGERGYLLTGDLEFREPYDTGRAEALEQVRTLRTLARDNPVQSRNVVEIERHLGIYLDEIGYLVRLQADGRHDEAVRIVRTGIGRRYINRALAAVERFEAEEFRLLAQRRAIQARSESRHQVLMYVLAGLGTLLIVLLLVALRRASGAFRLAVELATELQVQATTDTLTGLPNRRHLLDALEKEVVRAKRTGRPLAFALLDLDKFKAINDTHGHPSGDAVLRSVADVLKRVCRGGDLVGRFGGEEFAMLMPETSREEAEIACERIRKAIAKRTVAYPTGAFGRVTVSTGVAVFASEEKSNQFVARADTALYQAKQDGRNVVRLAA